MRVCVCVCVCMCVCVCVCVLVTIFKYISFRPTPKYHVAWQLVHEIVFI